MINAENNFQFELSTGNIYTDQVCIEQIEAGHTSRNLVQLLALGRVAILPSAEEASPIDDADTSIVPLLDMLDGAQDEYIESTTYDRLDVDEWIQDDYIQYGQWVDSLTRDPQQVRSRLTSGVLKRAYSLGIGPGIHRIRDKNRFSTLGAYYKALSVVPGREWKHYDTLTDQELADYGEGVLLDLLSQSEGQTGDPTLTQEIARRARLGEGPGLSAFRLNGRTLSEVMLLNGYYVGPPHMKPEDYVQLGARIRHANNGRELTREAMDFLAKSKRAPHSSSVMRKFRWADYLDQVQAAYERPGLYDIEQRLPTIKQEVKDGTLPFSVIEDATGPEVLTRRARWLLVNELLPKLDAQEKQIIVKFIRISFEGVIRVRGNISETDIKEAVARLDIAEDLGPPYVRYLRVPKKLMGSA